MAKHIDRNQLCVFADAEFTSTNDSGYVYTVTQGLRGIVLDLPTNRGSTFKVLVVNKDSAVNDIGKGLDFWRIFLDIIVGCQAAVTMGNGCEAPVGWVLLDLETRKLDRCIRFNGNDLVKSDKLKGFRPITTYILAGHDMIEGCLIK